MLLLISMFNTSNLILWKMTWIGIILNLINSEKMRISFSVIESWRIWNLKLLSSLVIKSSMHFSKYSWLIFKNLARFLNLETSLNSTMCLLNRFLDALLLSPNSQKSETILSTSAAVSASSNLRIISAIFSPFPSCCNTLELTDSRASLDTKDVNGGMTS